MIKNWWYYHKWYVICAVILLLAGIDILGNTFGWFKDTPDVQIAYIGDTPLPEDTAASIEDTFASLADDYNHDGKVLVKINQFVSSATAAPAENGFFAAAESPAYQQAAEIALIGDIEDCVSYFFLMEDPGYVQREYQVLAMPDGSCPDEYDFSIEDKVISWDFGLYLGRRCFYNKKQTPYADECSRIWNILKKTP